MYKYCVGYLEPHILLESIFSNSRTIDLYLHNVLLAHPALLELLGDDPIAKFETFSSTVGKYEGLYDLCAKHKSACKFHLEAKIEKNNYLDRGT